MLASHDSFTFQDATSRTWKRRKNYWRCQEKDLQSQYESGVRYFDIRVFRNADGYWQTCHGKAEFPQKWKTLKTLCIQMGIQFGDAKFRIVFEKGSAEDVQQFRDEIADCATKYHRLHWAVIKDPWETVFLRKTIDIVDVSFKNWNVGNCIKCSFKNVIKEFAEKQIIQQCMIDDPDTLYFKDYV